MTRATVGWITSCVLSVMSSLNVAAAAPTTEQYMNALTLCGVGSHIEIDSNSKEKVQLLFQSGVTQGKTVQDIVPKIAELIVTKNNPTLYDSYVKCLNSVLSYGLTPQERPNKLLASLNKNTPLEAIHDAYGTPTKILIGDDQLQLQFYDGLNHSLMVVVRNGYNFGRFGILKKGNDADITIPAFGSQVFKELSISMLDKECGGDNNPGISGLKPGSTDGRHLYFVTNACNLGRPGRFLTWYFGYSPLGTGARCRVDFADFGREVLSKLGCNKEFLNMKAEYVFFSPEEDERDNALAQRVYDAARLWESTTF